MTAAPEPSHDRPDAPLSRTKRRATRSWFAVAILVYLCFIGGFAAWHAAELWSWTRMSAVVAIPAVLVSVQCGPSLWRAVRDRAAFSVVFWIVAPLAAAVVLAGMGLALSYAVVESIGRWESRPVRTAAAIAGIVACAGAVWFPYRPTTESAGAMPRREAPGDDT